MKSSAVVHASIQSSKNMTKPTKKSRLVTVFTIRSHQHKKETKYKKDESIPDLDIAETAQDKSVEQTTTRTTSLLQSSTQVNKAIKFKYSSLL